MKLKQHLLTRTTNLALYRRQLEFRYAFWEQRLNQRPEPPSGAEFEFPCELGDPAELEFEGGGHEQAKIEHYMASGDRLAVIRYGSKVACRGLVRTHGHVLLEGHRRARPVREGEAFIHFCRTASAFAGRNLYPQMLRAILWTLAEQDRILEVTITCRDDNIGSIKGIERAGFRLEGRLCTIGLLGGRFARTWRTEVLNHHE